MARAKRPARPGARPRADRPPAAGVGWRALVLVLAGALAYATGLSGPFVFDDRASVVDNHTIEAPADLATVFWPPHETPVAGRPLVNLTFALNYAMGGRDVAGYHVANIAFHLLTGLVLFGLARRTFASPRLLATTGPAATPLAFAVALIWTLHPLTSEVVNYITQRTESLMALFLLLTLYGATRAWDGPSRVAWSTVAVLACALGMLGKETMVVAPALVVLHDRAFVAGSFREAFGRRAGLYAALASTWLLLALMLASSPRGLSAGFGAHDAAPWNYLLNQAVMIVEYLRLAAWPRSLALYYGWPVPLTPADVWPQAVVVISLVIGTVVAWVRRPALGFAGVWVFLTLAPTSSIIPIATEVGAERRMYLPLMALVALAVIGVRHLTSVLAKSSRGDLETRRRVALAGYVALVLVAALEIAGTMARTAEYQSSLTLAETTVARWPSPAGHSMLGVELAAAGRFEEAEAHLTTAAARHPPALYYLGTVLARRGRHDEAIGRLRAFIAGQPPELDQVYLARAALADALIRTGQTAAGVEEYRRMVTSRPSDFDAVASLADALVRSGAYDEAIARYQAYLATAPGDARAQGGLAVALAANGRLEQAIPAFRRAADLEPANARNQQNLARALAGAGRFGDAEGPATRAAGLAPADPAAHLLLGQVLAALGRTEAARAALERAVALDPTSPARELLKQIR